jgi:hypothetical protein
MRASAHTMAKRRRNAYKGSSYPLLSFSNKTHKHKYVPANDLILCLPSFVYI